MLIIKSALDCTLSQNDIKQLHQILTNAYASTEEEVWGKGYVRMPYEYYATLLKEGKEMFLAYLNDELVGSVHYYERKPKIYTFSLLSADLSKSGQGIGRALIQAVEHAAINARAEAIEIEILRARAEETEFKRWLASWYTSLGYQYTHSENFALLFPEKSKNLLQTSDFHYYRKELESVED